MNPENTLTNSEVALLGLLSEKAKHAWQIERDAEHRDMRSWTDLSQSTIYRQLTSLHKAGFVESTSEVVSGRARKIYSMTKQGRKALAKRLLAILGEPESPTWGVDLATYNLNLVPKAAAVTELKKYRKKLRELIKGFQETEEYMISCECPTNRLAVVRRPRYLLEADINWVDDFIDELDAAEGAD